MTNALRKTSPIKAGTQASAAAGNQNTLQQRATMTTDHVCIHSILGNKDLGREQGMGLGNGGESLSEASHVRMSGISAQVSR